MAKSWALKCFKCLKAGHKYIMADVTKYLNDKVNKAELM